MPADFDRCVAQGGKVRTIKPKPGRYMHVCYDKNGKSHAGEVMHSKKSDSNMNDLLEIRRIQQDKERQALDAEVTQSRNNFKARIAAAQKDPTLHIEVNDENED